MQNATKIKERIRAAEGRLETLTEWIAKLEVYRDELLRRAPAPGDHSRTAEVARAALHQVEHGIQTGSNDCGGEIGEGFMRRLPGLIAAKDEVRQLDRQLELLQEDLPSAEEVAEAEARVAALAEGVEDLRLEFEIQWSRLLDNLSEAVEVATEIAGFRRQYLSKALDLHRIADEAGLDRSDLPQAPRNPTDVLAAGLDSTTFARTLLGIVHDVIHGGEISVARLDALEQVRRKLRAQEVEAA